MGGGGEVKLLSPEGQIWVFFYEPSLTVLVYLVHKNIFAGINIVKFYHSLE